MEKKTNPYKPFEEDFEGDDRGFVQDISGSNPIGNETNNAGTRRIRLKALETETEHFLRLLNVSSIKWLIVVQFVSSCLILLSQILMYATTHTRYYKVVDFIGMGIWAPLLFFSVAIGLTHLTIRSPTGCLIGTSMGMQITSSIISSLLLLFACISLVQHGYYSYGEQSFNAEVPGRVFCSFMIVSTGAILVSSIFVSIHFCRAACCGRSRMLENVLFDVETVK